jgi:hypothetical protein
MTPEHAVIAELRSLFRQGATPSRLVRHVVEHHGRGPDTDRLIRAYFREAFGVPMLRASATLLDLPPEQLPFAPVTARYVHEMVEHRGEWDAESGWMDTLSATNVGTQFRQAHPEREPGLALVWEQLDEPTRDVLRRLYSSQQHLSETTAILSRLVEQLQAQVVALEDRIRVTASRVRSEAA